MEIEIDTDDLRLFAIIAHVLDQNDVQERIASIRKRWKVDDFISVDSFDDWVKGYHEDVVLTPEAAEIYNNAVERLEVDTLHHSITTLEELQMNKQLSDVRTIEYEIQYSLRKLRLPDSFYRILLKAVLCNRVSEEDIPEIRKWKNVEKSGLGKKISTEKSRLKSD